MDNRAKLLVACQQYLEGLITSQEWKWKAIEVIGDATQEDVVAICHLISEFAIHLRDTH